MCAFLLKLQVVQVCQSPGASVAAAALALELNANLVRHWLRDSQGGHARWPLFARHQAPLLKCPCACPRQRAYQRAYPQSEGCAEALAA